MTLEYLTVNEVAELVRADHRTVRRAIHRGELTAAFIGGKWLIRREAVQDWFDKRAAAASPLPAPAASRRAVTPTTTARRPTPTPRPDRAGSIARLRALN